MANVVERLRLKAKLVKDKSVARLAEYHTLVGLSKGYEDAANTLEAAKPIKRTKKKPAKR